MAGASELVAGRYELLEVLGRGGMGVVYRGRDRSLDRTVAVKVLPAQHASDELLVERFEREARAAARLNHPNIVAVYDSGHDGTIRYIVMECVPGMSLAQRLNEGGALPVPQAVEVAAQVADALAAAHAAGIVHRDIKPGNVMVQPSGACKVLDFGIARAATDAAMTQTSTLLGSAPYMAPETAMGRPAEPRSDIYALGCVLYEMLTDRPPFRGEVPAAVMNQHVSAQPEPPSQHRPGIPAALDLLVMRMLAKDPADRPQDADETATALRASLEEAPTTPLAATAATIPLAAAEPFAPTAPLAAAAPAPGALSAERPTPPIPPPRQGFPRWLPLAVLAALLAVGIALAVTLPGQNSATTSSSSTTSQSSSSQSSPSTSSATSTQSASSTTPSTSSTRSQTTSTPSSTTNSTSTSSRTGSGPTSTGTP